MRVAVIGGGKMGTALIAGFAAHLQPRPQLVVVGRTVDRVTDLAAQYDIEAAELADAVRDADAVVVAVKPYGVIDLLGEIGPLLRPGTLVASVAAGVRTAPMEEAVGTHAKVVRALPNTPSSIGMGVTAMSAGASCDAEGQALAVRLFEAIGDVVVVPEEQQDAISSLSGSGPAYLFYWAEAMMLAGRELGLDEASARTAVVKTLRGAAALLDETGADPVELRAAVTSPGGMTAKAIDVFDARAMRQAIVDAVAAARARSEEMGR